MDRQRALSPHPGRLSSEHHASQPAYGSADKGPEAVGDLQGSRRESGLKSKLGRGKRCEGIVGKGRRGESRTRLYKSSVSNHLSFY